MQKTKHVTFVFLMLVALGVTACSSDSNSVTGALKSMNTLMGETWVLQSYGPQGNPRSVLKGSKVTAFFDEAKDTVSGSAGCNQYFASFAVDGNTLSATEAGSTMMYCAGMMEQEDQYLTTLQAAETYQVQENQLQVVSVGDQVLNFVLQENM